MRARSWHELEGRNRRKGRSRRSCCDEVAARHAARPHADLAPTPEREASLSVLCGRNGVFNWDLIKINMGETVACHRAGLILLVVYM